MPEGYPGRVEEEDVGQMTGWFRGSAGGTRGASGDDGSCPVNCGGGNIRGPPYPRWGTLYACHDGP